MSHVVEIKAKIKDLAALKAAFMRMGGSILDKQTYRWFERWVGDYPLPEGVSVADLGHCDFAVGFPGCSYEVGVVKSGNEYRLRWDFWDGSLRTVMGGPEGGLFLQAYAVEKAKLEAKRKGLTAVETKLPNGSIKLEVKTRG